MLEFHNCECICHVKNTYSEMGLFFELKGTKWQLVTALSGHYASDYAVLCMREHYISIYLTHEDSVHN